MTKNSMSISLPALKTLNLKKDLVRILTISGDNSIPNLSKETGSSIPTITKLIAELIDEGIVDNYGPIDTNGGRKPSAYGINPKTFYYLGIEVKRHSVSIGILSADNKMVKISENINYTLENNRDSLNKLCVMINSFTFFSA